MLKKQNEQKTKVDISGVMYLLILKILLSLSL